MKKRRFLLLYVGVVFVFLLVAMIFSYQLTYYSFKEKIRNFTLISQFESELTELQFLISDKINHSNEYEAYDITTPFTEFTESYAKLERSLLYQLQISNNQYNAELQNQLLVVKKQIDLIKQNIENSISQSSIDSILNMKKVDNTFNKLLVNTSELKSTYYKISGLEQQQLETILLVKIVVTTLLFASLIIWLIAYMRRVDKTQNKILESETKYKSIFLKSPLGIFHYDKDGNITEFNDTFVEILGSSKNALLGLNIFDKLNDEKLKEEVKKSLEGEEGYYEDLYDSITSNKKVYIKLHLRGIRNENGEIISGLGVGEDITEKKSVEKNLLESLKHNKAIVSAMPDLLFQISSDGIFMDYKAQDDHDLLLQPDNFIGKSVDNLFDDNLAKLIMERIETTLSTNEMQVFDYPMEEQGVVSYYEARMVRSGDDSVLAIIRDITETKTTAELLIASRERYETFINETHEAIYRIEFTEPIYTKLNPVEQARLFYKFGYIAECNNAFVKMYGAAAFVDVIGKSIEDFHELENFPENFNQTVELIENKYRVENQRTVEKDQNGKVHYFSNNAFGIVENDYLIRMWGTQRDITNMIEAEEEKKILYRAIEQSQVSIVITDLNGNIEYVNPKFETVTGYTFEEVFGKNPRFLKSGLDDGTLHSDLWDSISHGQNWTGIFHNKKKNGELFFESATISPIADEDGNIRHYVAVKEDITELTKAQLELKNYKEYLEQVVEKRTEELNNKNIFLRTLIDTIPNPVFVKNRDGEYTDVNKAFVEMFGINFGDIIGQTIHKIATEKTINAALAADKKLLTEHNKMVYESAVIDKNKNEIPIMVYKASFGPEGEIPEGIAGLIIDITESKKTQMQMLKSLEQERELNEMKTNFISLASHELRTPLTAIYSSTELLERFGKKWPEEKFNSHIARIKYSVDNLTDLMEDMLTLTRVDTGKIVFNPRSLPLKSVVNENINALELLKKENHKLDVNYSLNSDHYILDEKLIKYVIQNLLSNAIKYSPEGGSIRLDLWDDHENIFIRVSDEGIGIPNEEMENLFEPFFRGKNVANFSGTGLGLSIVKEAVELHGGNIIVKSELNNGSKFEITLPIIK